MSEDDDMTHKAAGEELRGSAPVMSAKDLLLEMRTDVKSIGRNVDILVSQDLDARVSKLERWAEGRDGRVAAQAWKIVVAVIMAMLAGGAALAALHTNLVS